ncbi:MAG: ABC transporter permease [Bacteroidota bacterium]
MNKEKASPSKLFLHFFRWYCHPKLQKYVEGDLMELYDERVQKSGKRKADIKFIIDVLLLFRPGIIRPAEGHQNLNTYGMYKSYFKIGWRNLVRNKGYSFINIGGLALGMTITILITLWLHDELSYNRYYENYDHIAKVYHRKTSQGQVFTNTYQVPGLGTLLKDEYGSHFKSIAMRGDLQRHVLDNNGRRFTEPGYFVQPQLPEMFSFKMIQGTRTGLNDPKSILLSESLAKKLFPGVDALNQSIVMDSEIDLKVAGIFQDLPKNVEMNEAAYFASFDQFIKGYSSLNTWDNYFANIYVELLPEESVDRISNMISDSMMPFIDKKTAELKPQPFLLPMSKWYLYSEFKNGINITSPRLQAVFYYGMIGLFVLLLACINFMNLATARSEKRSREVGVRKSIGSLRSQLIQQFYSESLMMAFFSLLISLLLVQLTLPYFNLIAEKNISMPWDKLYFWLGCLSFTFLTGLLAGSYPALYLSSFNPVSALKGTFKTSRFAAFPRRVLVVIQFTFSISLIIATIVVYLQLDFGKNRPAGYSREGLISLFPRSAEFKGKYEALRNELKRTGMVDEIAESNYPVTSTLGWNNGFEWKGYEQNDLHFNINRVTHEYGKTIGWQFVAGRDFSNKFASDISGLVLNESAVKLMGLKEPVGTIVTRVRAEERKEFVVIGVIKDMIKGSPFEETDPCMFFLSDPGLNWLYVRLDTGVSAKEALPEIESAFLQLIPSEPFEFTFADADYDDKFKAEKRISKLASISSAVAILISCLGLFGLASFVAERRTKEIGIRKVLGASVANLWRMLSKEFVGLVILSAAIAIPLSYYLMNQWLAHYIYKISIPWYVLVVSASGALIVTILTISYQTLKAAIANPVKNLRSE